MWHASDKHYKIILSFSFLWQKYDFLSAFAQHTAGACQRSSLSALKSDLQQRQLITMLLLGEVFSFDMELNCQHGAIVDWLSIRDC